MTPENPFHYGPRDAPATVDPSSGLWSWAAWIAVMVAGWALVIWLL